MSAKIIIAARRFADGGAITYEKGDVVGMTTENGDFGSAEVPPDYVRLEITDATHAEAQQFLSRWDIDFAHEIVAQNASGWRIRISVDPQYIDAAGKSAQAIKSGMLRDINLKPIWEGSSIVSFTQTEIVVDIPKNGAWQTEKGLKNAEYLAALKSHFSDIFQCGFASSRWHFSEADVDAAIAANPDGHITGTKAQVLNKLLDKLA